MGFFLLLSFFFFFRGEISNLGKFLFLFTKAMPFPMKIQPINDEFTANRDLTRVESNKPVLKSRLKRLLDRPFTNVLKSSVSDKSIIAVTGEAQYGGGTEFEPSSVVLAKMVQSYMEENNNEKQTKFGRNHRCNCFNGNNDSSSDDEFDLFDGCGSGDYFNDAYDHFKVKLNNLSLFFLSLSAKKKKTKQNTEV